MPAEEVQEEVVEEPEIPLDPQTALFRVIQTSLHHEGLARGLHEAVKGQHSAPQRRTARYSTLQQHSTSLSLHRLVTSRMLSTRCLSPTPAFTDLVCLPCPTVLPCSPRPS